jgi:hypothetical protein
MAAPFVLAWAALLLQRHFRTLGVAFAAAAVPAVLLSGGALSQFSGMGRIARQGSYAGIVSAASNDYRGYLASPDFHGGAVYRVLSPNEREQGAYYLMRRHGVLANELFSESQRRRNWDEDRYRCYLAAKHVDRVVVERGYSRQFGTNEPSLLQDLVARGQARLTYGASGDGITVYDVTPFRDGAPAPASVKECGRL